METLYSRAHVEALLYAAGRTAQALHVPGCWPAGYRTNMPDYLPEPGDYQDPEAELRADQPLGAEVSAHDRVLGWIARLPRRTPVQVRACKLVLDRMRVNPLTDRKVFSWRRLGDKYGVSHEWARQCWEAAVDDLTGIANRQLSAPCAGTLARIRAASLKPLPPPCAATLARISAAAPQPPSSTPAPPRRELLAA